MTLGPFSFDTFRVAAKGAIPFTIISFVLLTSIALITGTNIDNGAELIRRSAVVLLLCFALGLFAQYVYLLRAWLRARRDRLRGMPGSRD